MPVEVIQLVPRNTFATQWSRLLEPVHQVAAASFRSVQLDTLGAFDSSSGNNSRAVKDHVKTTTTTSDGSVAMAVAEATHHSAPRRQKTATAIREVEEHASHGGLRAQTALPPGARPGILAEPGPQRSDRTVRHSAGEAPLLVVASLAGGDDVDVTTAKFLLRSAIRELEEERNLEERSKADRHLQAMTELVRWRKRKKRRKKKTPKSSSFRSSSVRLRRGGQGSRSRSCARPCAHQRHVLAVLVVRELGRAPVPVHRQNGGHSCFMSMNLADPVSSGKYSGFFVFTAPVAELTVMSFTVPLNVCTIVATATVVTSCSSSAGCPGSAAPMCCGGVCVVEVSLLMVLTILFGTA